MANPQLIGNVIFTGTFTASTVTGNFGALGIPGFALSASPDTFVGAPNEMLIYGGYASGNVLRVQNPNTAGYSAWNCIDSTGLYHFAGGVGNASSLGIFAGYSYFESASVPPSGGGNCLTLPIRFVMTQNSPVPSGLRGGFKPRIDVNPDGTINFYKDTAVDTSDAHTAHDSTHNIILCLQGGANTDAPIVTLGGQYWDGAEWSGDRGIQIQFYDTNTRIFGRTTHDGIQMNAFGSGISTHDCFTWYSGGSLGSQTLRAEIANDGAAFYVPLTLSGALTLSPQAAPGSPVEGEIWQDSTAHKLKYYDGTATQTLANVSGIPAGANPIGSSGLTAVNGSATTFLRSDGAPAISQAIVPTWSGLHTFSAGITSAGGTFTGAPVAPTATSGTNTTQLATTAFVTAAVAAVGVPSAANPTGTVGTTAVNGSATTFMRSDAAPPLNLSLVPTILSTTTAINAKTVANTALYTVPTGKTCVITGYVVRALSGTTGITIGPSAGVGNTAGTSNIAASQAMTGLQGFATSGNISVFSVPIVGSSSITSAAGVIYLNLGTAATGTSMTIAVDLIGYIF